MIETLLVVQSVVLVFGVPVLVYLAKLQIEKSVRVASEKALADYRTLHAKELEEFGLYARARYRVYAKLHRQLRIAADTFSTILGVSSRPDFARFDSQHATEYFESHKIPVSARAEIVVAMKANETSEAARLLNALHDRVEFHRGARAFQKARAIEVLELLYLSDDVQAGLAKVRRAMAKVSSELDPRDGRRRREAKDSEPEMRTALDELYRIMRAELRRV